jgi:hypothetical protein
MPKHDRRFRVRKEELHKIIFALYKATNVLCFRNLYAWQRMRHINKVINGTFDDSKHYPFDISQRNTYDINIKSLVVEETILDMDDSTATRWIKPVFSSENNCINMQQIDRIDPMDKYDRGRLSHDILPHDKSKFTMAHHFYAAQLKDIRGSCRTCSRDVNRHTVDSYGLLIMDSGFHLLPDCSMKLSTSDNLGFTILVSIYLDDKRLYEIEEIVVCSQELLNIFSNVFSDLFPEPRLSTKIQEHSKVSNTELSRCTIRAVVKRSDRNEYQTGALEEALRQGYYPLFNTKKGAIQIDVEQAKLIQKIGEIESMITRSCNPYLYTDELDILSRDSSIYDTQSDLTSHSMEKWPLLYLGLTDNLRIKVQDELKYGSNYSFLNETMIKGLKREAEDNLIEFGIDKMKFWM